MGQKQKHRWIVVEPAGAPVRVAAARTLRHRLDVVWEEATGCAMGGGVSRSTSERVHRLRVATRRALASIEAFADLMPPRRRDWFRARLRRLRRAAGNARDLDVLTARLAAARARARLLAMLSRQRDVSRQPIREVYEELLAADWPRRVDALIARVGAVASGSRPDARGDMPFGRYARRRFRPLMNRFFIRADQPLHTAEEMHTLRIEGKKLRYALEIFAGVFSPGVRETCEAALERLQESLGTFTDHAAAAERFRRWARDKRMAADRESLIELEHAESARADVARRAFTDWWNASRRRGLRRTFERSLARGTA